MCILEWGYKVIMNRLVELIFYCWILSIPFYRFSLVGTLSLDNILGPLLIIIWPLFKPRADPLFARVQSKNIIIASVILFVYFFAHIVSVLSAHEAFWKIVYTTITDLTYFIVPLLYLRNDRIRSNAEDCVIVIALIGAFSAFLSALGILQLEVARYSDSRVNIESLDLTRSIGLFSSFGDMALLSAFSVMVAMSVKRQRLLFLKRSRQLFLLIIAILLLGLLGSQSRNMVLTISVSIIMYLFVKKLSKRNVNWIPKFYTSLTVVAVSLLVFVVFLWEPVVGLLASWGGSQATGTAYARLEQYQFALELMRGDYMIGADAEIQEEMVLVIANIHNMWLKELVQGGLIAVLMLVGLIVLGMKNATKCIANNKSDEAARTSLVLMVASLVTTQFYAGGTSVFWMLLGFAVAKIYTGEVFEKKSVAVQNQTGGSENNLILKRKRSSFIPRRGG